MIIERVKKLPAPVRRWAERELGYKIPETYELSLYALNPSGRAKRLEESRHESDRRDRRLKIVAGKMRKAGMDERDIETVIRRGWN